MRIGPISPYGLLTALARSYFTPEASAGADVTTHHSNVDAIVAGVVCSLVGLVLALAATFWYIRRRRGGVARVGGSSRGSWGMSRSIFVIYTFHLLT